MSPVYVCLCVCCVCVTSVRDNLLMLVVMVMTVRLILHSVRRVSTLNCKSKFCYVPSVCLSVCVLCVCDISERYSTYAGSHGDDSEIDLTLSQKSIDLEL